MQTNDDGDPFGNACDACPGDPLDDSADNEGVCGDLDNCPTISNGNK